MLIEVVNVNSVCLDLSVCSSVNVNNGNGQSKNAMLHEITYSILCNNFNCITQYIYIKRALFDFHVFDHNDENDNFTWKKKWKTTFWLIHQLVNRICVYSKCNSCFEYNRIRISFFSLSLYVSVTFIVAIFFFTFELLMQLQFYSIFFFVVSMK